jgi:hypothetical protein
MSREDSWIGGWVLAHAIHEIYGSYRRQPAVLLHISNAEDSAIRMIEDAAMHRFGKLARVYSLTIHGGKPLTDAAARALLGRD